MLLSSRDHLNCVRMNLSADEHKVKVPVQSSNYETAPELLGHNIITEIFQYWSKNWVPTSLMLSERKAQGELVIKSIIRKTNIWAFHHL